MIKLRDPHDDARLAMRELNDEYELQTELEKNVRSKFLNKKNSMKW